MPSKILIVTSSVDLTSDYLISIFKEIEFVRLNVDQFSKYRILVNEKGVTLKSKSWQYRLTDINAIYYRKPSLPNLNGIVDKQYESFIHKEIFSFIEGIVESFPGKCLSKPSILRTANNKIVQCLMAKQLGFNIPPSRITNSQQWACSNYKNESIVKPVSLGTICKEDSRIIVQTNIVNENIPMDMLQYCPSYFQDFIPKDYEVRITFAGKKSFPVKIKSQDIVDWRRKDNKVDYEVISVPQKIISQCEKMLSIFNLKFGCFDFVVKDNKYYFLEVNANGQWAWLETELGIDISGAIMEELS